METYSYETFYSGLPSDLQQCTTIYLYVSHSLTLDNLHEDLENILKMGKRVERQSTKIPFKVKREENSFKFNTIIYFRSDGNLIGFTKFSTIQNSESSTKVETIELDLSFREDSINEVEFGLKLSINRASVLSRSYLNGEYSYVSEIKAGPKKHSWTNEVSSLVWDDNSTLISDELVYTSLTNTAYSLDFKQDLRLDDYDLIFNKFWLGYWNKESCLYAYNSLTGKYKTISLLRSNKFGDPEVLSFGTIDEENRESLIYMANQFAIFPYKKYDLFKREYTEYDKRDLLIDQLDPSGKLYISNGSMELTPKLPELNSLYNFKFDSDFDNLIRVSERRGPWWVIYQRDPLTKKTHKMWVSMHGMLRSTEGDECFPISSRCLLCKYMSGVNGKGTLSYILYFFDDSEWETDNYRSENATEYGEWILRDGVARWNTRSFSLTNDLIRPISTMRDQAMDGIRRSRLRQLSIPNIIGSLSGVLFSYSSEGKVNYL